MIVENSIINIAFCLLILGPIFILSYLDSELGKLGVVLACVFLAAPVVSTLATRTQTPGFGVMAG